MAKIKPTASTPKFGALTMNGKLKAAGAICDVVGTSECPVVDQLACVGGALVYAAAGEPVEALLSVASMVPVAGKLADAAKLARRVEHGVEVANGVVKTNKVAKAAKKAAPKPSKTKAKGVEKKSVKETQTGEQHFDSNEWLGLDNNVPAGDSIFSKAQPSARSQQFNFNGYNIKTNSNPSLNNKFTTTGKPFTSGKSTNMGI